MTGVPVTPSGVMFPQGSPDETAVPTDLAGQTLAPVVALKA